MMMLQCSYGNIHTFGVAGSYGIENVELIQIHYSLELTVLI